MGQILCCIQNMLPTLIGFYYIWYIAKHNMPGFTKESNFLCGIILFTGLSLCFFLGDIYIKLCEIERKK